MSENKMEKIDIPDLILDEWQGIADIIAKVIDVPSGLIMKLNKQYLEVLISSKTSGNPFRKGGKSLWNLSGLYCEQTIKSNNALLVPNAFKDPVWENEPDALSYHMVSYLGFPIHYPDGSPFGTICVLDRKENHYSIVFKELMEKFRDMIEAHIHLIYMNEILLEKNQEIQCYLDEIQSLKGLIPICAQCKKIKDTKGTWKAIEAYLIKHPQADFTHGYCPECAEQAMRDIDAYEV